MIFSTYFLLAEIARGDGGFPIRNTWLIEITGGPNTECDTCPNYDMEDLANYYWPALIAGVLAYTGEDQVDYVGHSNGCRTALESLELWQENGKISAGQYVNENGAWEEMSLPAESVYTFVGIGCPGAFEGDNAIVASAMKLFGESSIRNLEDQGITHVSLDKAYKVIPEGAFLKTINFMGGDVDHLIENEGNKISLNLYKDYIGFAKNTNDTQPGNFSVDHAAIIGGHILPVDIPYVISIAKGAIVLHGNYGNDQVVTHEDITSIYQNIDSNDKTMFYTWGWHIPLPETDANKIIIKKTISGIDFTDYERKRWIVEESQ